MTRALSLSPEATRDPDATTDAVPTAARRRARRDTPPAAPLGSLTQLRSSRGCAGCGSGRVTHLAMNLTDGTPVVFTSCHHCEERRWEHEGETLSVTDVIERTRKPA